MHRFQADKHLIPPRNLVEIRFEQFEADPMAELRRTYESLDLPGFEAAEPRFRDYLASLAGYQKNDYNLDQNAIDTVQRHWGFAIREWGYEPPRIEDESVCQTVRP
jgi:hypothetical protein